MRYRVAEKLEIIRLVEQSSLSVRRTLAQLGISRATFYRWYGRYLARGAGALEDGQSAPRRVWNKLPPTVAAAVLALALQEPELSPRELATAFVDQRLLKAADRFAQPTTAINQLWQTDFTYLRVVGWGWFYLSTVLDDFSRYILAWKLCSTMTARLTSGGNAAPGAQRGGTEPRHCPAAAGGCLAMTDLLICRLNSAPGC